MYVCMCDTQPSVDTGMKGTTVNTTVEDKASMSLNFLSGL